jgi:dsDNA-specific endonuclease/ATPase MutS2
MFKGKPITQSQLSNLLYKQAKADRGKDKEHSGSDEFKKIKDTVSTYRAGLKKQKEEAEKQKRELEAFHKNFNEWLNKTHQAIHEYLELPLHEREAPEAMRNIFGEAYTILKSGEKALKATP